NHAKFIVAHIIAASVVGVVAAAATSHYRHRKSKPKKHHNSAPKLERTESGRIDRVERFCHYVARQLGFEDPNECPQLCKLANEYLKKSKGCEANMYEYFSGESDADSLYVKLVEELDKFILSYFAFHWSQAPLLISQVLGEDSDQQNKRLKNFVMAATRKQRFERVTKDLKVTRLFSTLVEEIKAIGGISTSNGGEPCTDVMVPVAHSQRSPVLLLMGGGMGAAANAVVVEADAFKETDVIYRRLSSNRDDLLQTAELVHQSSTDAASSLLVTALNEGRDVILDGTLAWVPFVEQTIAMARNVHKCRYRMGVGYKVAHDGTVTENYWEKVEEEENVCSNGEVKIKPYRIEMVGVVCDPYLAVVRGIRRAILVGRAVRVNLQLKSHKRFATAFPSYCKLVDNARLYSTNALGGPPRLIGWKDGDNNLLVDPEEIKCLSHVSSLNDEADTIYDLYNSHPSPFDDPRSVWNDIVLSPSRVALQSELKISIQKIEALN
ncbi:Zeta toxin domain, partial [Dillenia turbinata]